MKLQSFGCSFICGDDLSDHSNIEDPLFAYSKKTWPALIAKNLGLQYECHARPARGNFYILSQIIMQSCQKDPGIFVINWTWIDRHDYIDDQEFWTTLMPGQRTPESKFYYRYLHSQLRDMLSTVYAINTAIDWLEERHIPFLMTYMDYNILTPIDPDWHDPRYLSAMQDKIRPYLYDFDGQNLLDWSKTNDFAISPNWHPLDQAHESAAQYLMPLLHNKLS